MAPADDVSERRAQIARVLRRQRARLERKLEGLRGDLAEAERAPEHRRMGEILLTYGRQVPARAAEAVLPDPADPSRNVAIPLDPAVSPQVNAARYFKRAAKAERGLKEVPPRLRAVEAEAHALGVLLARVAGLEEGASDSARPDDPSLDAALEKALAGVPETQRGGLRPESARDRATRPGASAATASGAGGAAASGARGAGSGPGARKRERIPARLIPRRLKTREGWDVLIGRTNEGNDYVSHTLARPEDYWLHVHGAAGSHVVVRRGKGKNEPSKATIEEVASWAAFYSQARNAGKVPVIVTRKKYVRKPRKGPPGLALCTNEKTVMVRPQEPPREALADVAEAAEAESNAEE